MSRFSSAGHLVSLAKFTPTTKAPAGKIKASSTGKGNPWIGATLGEAAIGGLQDYDLLGARYRRTVRRPDEKRALVAVGDAILTIAYQLLFDPQARFANFGADLHNPAPATPSPPIDPRAQIPLRQEGHPPHGGLTTPTGPAAASHRHEPGSAHAPPGATACALTIDLIQHEGRNESLHGTQHVALWGSIYPALSMTSTTVMPSASAMAS